MIFSHGLGGNRNAYSHLAGSLASYGVVVICPEHRDGSAALSLIRDPEGQDLKRTRHIVPYNRIPHLQTREVWEARDKQLRIRLWELGLVFEAVTALDSGDKATIKANLNHSTPIDALSQFANQLDVLEPGKVIFAGHSFGAVTMTQFLKSTFYADHPAVSSMANPLFKPFNTSAIAHQVTPHNPTILLDMWCFPLLSASTAALYDLPLPCYHRSSASASGKGVASPPPPGGAGLLAVESQAFFDWTEHLHVKARILSPQPTARTVTADMFTTTTTNPTGTTTPPDKEEEGFAPPHFFHVTSSAHLHQSDFGLLFPWLTRRVFKAEAPPARVLRLNVRAQLQFLRSRGVRVAATGVADLVDGPLSPLVKNEGDDAVILERVPPGEESKVEAWTWIDVVGMGAEAYPTESEMAEGAGERGEQEVRAEEGEREMQGEIEPSLEMTGPEATAAVVVATH
jgi:platelet-activating factor acetylhydrolase